jgi:hypothetical protein
MKGKIALLLGIGVLAAGLAFVPVHALEIKAVKPGRVVFATLVRPGVTLRLSFIHSVEHSPVEDFFRIDETYRLVLYETRFRSMNTGLPTAAYGAERFARTAEGFRVTNMQRILPAIETWVHRDYDNTLRINGRTLRLPDLAGNTLLRLSVEQIPLGRLLLLRWERVRR